MSTNSFSPRPFAELNQALFDEMAVGVIYQDLTGRILAANRVAQDILGLPGDFISNDYLNITLRKSIHEDGSLFLPDELPGRRAIYGGKIIRDVVIGIQKPLADGITWINVTSFPHLDRPNQPPTIVISTIEDITVRKTAEKQVRQITRLYATLSQINQAIVRTRNRQDLFEDVCKVAIDYGEFAHAWIGLFDRHSGLVTCAAASRPLPFETFSVNKPPFNTGLIYSVLQSGKLAVTSAIQNDPTLQRWQSVLAELNLQSAAIIPLCLEGQAIGIFNLFAADSAFFKMEHETSLFEEIGQDISFALESLEKQKRREEAELALHESMQRYRLISENAADVIWVMDPYTGKFSYVSPSVEKLRGYTPAEVMAQPVSESLTPESLAEVSRLMNQSLPPFIARGSGSESHINLVDQPHKNGSIIHTEATTTFTFNAQGKVEIIGVTRDITDRKQAEARILSLVDRFDLAARAANLGVWEYDLRQGQQIWDERMFNLYGVQKENFSASYSNWFNCIHPEDRPRLEKIVRLALSGEAEYDTEYRVVWPDGSVHWLKTNGQLIPGTDGQPVRMIGVNYDITEQKLAEEEIRRFNLELEKHVRERTALLAAANQELEAFAYSVSHDLRAPLRALNGFSAILQEDYQGKLDEQGLRYLSYIQEASTRMDRLINDLLNLSRVTRADFNRQRVDLSSLAQSIAEDLKSQAPQRQVEFDIAAGLVVEGDANILKIAMENLLNNAFKFTGNCSQAAIQVGAIEQDGERVYFVRDNGAGFDMNYASKLFAPFQRLHSAEEFPGTGIGLSIVQRIITRHGGRIWPISEVNRGTTFYFTLGN